MNKTINELTALTDAVSSDELIIYDVSTGESKKITKQNLLKELQTEVNGKQNSLTFDSTPTEDSENPVKSGGVYGYINNLPKVELTASGLTVTTYRLGIIFIVILSGTYTGTTSQNIIGFETITNNDFKPTQVVSLVLTNVTNDKPQGQMVITPNGEISLYGGYDTITNGQSFSANGLYVK